MENSTIDGSRWTQERWAQMDWGGKEWKDSSVWGDDPHWNVPHTDGETLHRVRQMQPADKAFWEDLDKLVANGLKADITPEWMASVLEDRASDLWGDA